MFHQKIPPIAMFSKHIFLPSSKQKDAFIILSQTKSSMLNTPGAYERREAAQRSIKLPHISESHPLSNLVPPKRTLQGQLHVRTYL